MGMDLSFNMISVAGQQSATFTAVEFFRADSQAWNWPLPVANHCHRPAAGATAQVLEPYLTEEILSFFGVHDNCQHLV
jgi:hypothetical protein